MGGPVASVVLLGTGTPRMERDRAGPSTAVVVDGHPYIFDFGPGIGARLSQAYTAGIAGLAMSRVTRAFLTHHHSDHTLGLGELILIPWMFGREEPLHVYGPWGTAAMAASLEAAFRLDVAKRRHNEPHTDDGHAVMAHDIFPGPVYEDSRISVEAFAVVHGSWIEELHGPHPALGYRVRAADRTIVISGDTAPFDAMADVYADADVLVHEVYSSAGLAERSADWQTYHRAAHTAAEDLGRIAGECRPHLLVLTHQLLWHAEPGDLESELRAVYDGPVHYGHDLDVV